MRLSGGEAYDLLRKWTRERTPVRALLESGSSPGSIRHAVMIRGFVNGIPTERSTSILISDAALGPGPDPNNLLLIVDAKIVESFEYIEAKDFDKPEEARKYAVAIGGISCLSFNLASGDRISIFEIEQ